MPIWLKVLLLVMVAIVLIMGAVGIGGAYWLKANKGRLQERGAQAAREGQAFGEKSDAEGCIREALARSNQRSGILDQAMHKVFLKFCVAAAHPPAEFCRDVPRADDVVQSLKWSIDECGRRGGSQFCSNLLQGIGDFCHPKEKGAPRKEGAL